MTTDDADWIRIFGTNSNQLEPPPRMPAQRRKTKAQREARFILDHPELFKHDQQPKEQKP